MTSDCQHENFTAKVGVARMGDDGGPISCSSCGLPFHFLCPGCRAQLHTPDGERRGHDAERADRAR